MTIYLAASWNVRMTAGAIRDQFQAAGVTVRSRWLDVKFAASLPENEVARQEARNDVEDIRAADALVLLADFPSSSGGMHFETGYAYALGKPVFIIGKQSMVFHHLPTILVFSDVSACIRMIQAISAATPV